MHEGVVLSCLVVESKGSWCNHEHFIGALPGPALHGLNAVLLGCSRYIWNCTNLDVLSPEQPANALHVKDAGKQVCESLMISFVPSSKIAAQLEAVAALVYVP